ncbi:MAG: MW1434 family type I TA system toxin [Candidatus Bathyarchaeia archaeon]
MSEEIQSEKSAASLVMNQFIGSKLLKAASMNLGLYNIYRGRGMLKDEDIDEPGYLVEYLDGGESNHPENEGYISWSPAKQFEDSYQRLLDGISFAHALTILRKGDLVARKRWVDAGVYLTVIGVSEDYLMKTLKDGGPCTVGPRIVLINSKTKEVDYNWQPTQQDLLTDDWYVITPQQD